MLLASQFSLDANGPPVSGAVDIKTEFKRQANSSGGFPVLPEKPRCGVKY